MHSAIDIPNLSGFYRYTPLYITPISPTTNLKLQKVKLLTSGPIFQQKLDPLSMRDFKIRQLAKKHDQSTTNNDELTLKNLTNSVIIEEDQPISSQAPKKGINLHKKTKSLQQSKNYIQQAMQVKPLNLISKENGEVRSVSPSLERPAQLSINLQNPDTGAEKPLKRDLNSSSQFKTSSAFWSRANMAHSSNPGSPHGRSTVMGRPNTSWNETRKKKLKKELDEQKRKEELVGITGLPLSKKQLSSITKINIGDKMLSGYVLPSSMTTSPTNYPYRLTHSSVIITGEGAKKNGLTTSISHRTLQPNEVKTPNVVSSAAESFRNSKERSSQRRESIGNFPVNLEAGIIRQNPYNTKPSVIRQDNCSTKGISSFRKQQQTPVENFIENISSPKKPKALNIEVAEDNSEFPSADLKKQNYMLVGDKFYKQGLTNSKKLKSKLDGSDVTKLGTTSMKNSLVSTTLDKPNKVTDGRTLRKLSSQQAGSQCENTSFELEGWGQDGDLNTEF